MSKRQRLELKMLIMILDIINRFLYKYSLTISQINPKINIVDVNSLCAIDQLELMDNMDKYSPLSIADFLEIYKKLQKDQKYLDGINCNLIFISERVFRVDQRNRQNRDIHFICLEKAKEGGLWTTRVLPKTFLDANMKKYKVACIKRK